MVSIKVYYLNEFLLWAGTGLGLFVVKGIECGRED